MFFSKVGLPAMFGFLLLTLARAEDEKMFPPGGASIDFRACQYSQAVKPVSPSDPVWISVRCMPAAITDNLFCVMENNPIPMSFQYRRARAGNETKPEFMDLVLTHPEGFHFWPGLGGTRISEMGKDGLRTVRFRFKPNTIPSQYAAHLTCHVLIGTTRKASEELYPLNYHLEYSGIKTEPCSLNLKVLPSFKGESPHLFRSGVNSTNDFLFARGNGMEQLVETIRNTGFNLVYHNTHDNSRDLSDVLTEAGIFTATWDYFFINGYTLGFGLQSMPEEVKFIGKDGKPLKFNSWHCNLCPVAAYTRSDFFNRNFLEYLGEKITKYNFSSFFRPNWEPFEFDDKGCFCPRCREEFINYSGLPRETVLKAWPDEMTGKYRKIWVKFRSWQHAKVVGAILDGMRELSEKYHREFVFCPAVGIGDLFAFSSFYDQYTVRDYIDKLDWLDPWGPYIFHNAAKPHLYNIGTNYGVYRTARLAKERVKELCRNGKTPRLAALPHAYQSAVWVTEPEAMAYETAAYFVNGWEQSELYVFTGLDGRYWRVMGELNNAIAQVDSFVFLGQKMDNVTMTQESPCPHPMAVYDANNPTLARYAGEMRKESPVTLDAFKLQDKVMLALGNAWQRGEAFVKVSIPGLPDGVKYAVSIPGRKITLATDYSASDLADGILLHVGAFHFCFYVIEPFNPEKDYGRIAGRDALASLLKERMPEIRKKYEEDLAYAAEFVQSPSYDFGQMPSLSAGSVSVKPKRNLSDSVLSIRTPHYSCDLDMGNGGGIVNYAVNGKTIIDAKSFMLRDGLVEPPLLLTGPYEFIGWEAKDEGAAVTLRCKLGVKDGAQLKGLTFIKRYTFGEKMVMLQEELKNEGASPITFAYRLHSMPSVFDKNGSLAFDGGQTLTRSAEPLFHPAPGYSGSCFDGKNSGSCTGESAVFTGTGGSLKISWDMPHFIGVYRWDAAGAAVPSFELVSDKITLQAGEKVFFSIMFK